MSKFFAEVKQQPEAIRATVRNNADSKFPAGKPLLLTGMGSSLAASELLVSYLNGQGIPALAVDNSELLYYGSESFIASHRLVIVSQSGESYEAKKLAERYPDALAITNSPEGSLAKLASEALLTHAGKEEAIASSKSFTTTAALMLQLGARMAGNDLTGSLLAAADVIEAQLEQEASYRALIRAFLDPLKPMVLLGRGPSVYTARQGSLTLKETARIFAEAASAPQFRHGPFELIKENLQAVFFNPKGSTYEINRSYVTEMADLGAKVLYVSDEPLAHERVESIVIPSVDEYVSPIVYSLVVQLAAVELSTVRGLVAGEAQIITKVTGKE
ncbi:SIS domain-containing protein [Cohnella sp. GbtcB17]|uniref:SIS domain-containing protein n=1 Tax=Cohnella sp. GbtcB17 TaxID=2824762 RepID=UPI001C3085C7|nr:SIS domain-containing protein [Cohnella sp. GbtcB17]